MRKMSYVTLVSSVVMFFMSFGCSGGMFHSSSSGSSSKSSAPSEQGPTVEEKLVDHFNKLSPEEKKEFLKQNVDIDATNGKDFQVCLWFNKNSTSDDHKCNHATFFVELNDERAGELNLNNYAEKTGELVRSVTGISGTPYTITAGDNVPGTLYKTKWKNGEVKIHTVCNTDGFNKPFVDTHENDCHNGIANLSVIGNVVVKYNDQLLDMYFSEQKGLINTKVEEKYNLNNRDSYDSVSLSINKPSFNDWCSIQ